MADKNQNGIPDSWDRPLGALLTLAGLAFAGLAYNLDPCPWWVAFAAGLTTTIGGAFKIGVVLPRWPSATVLAFGLVAVVGSTACIDPLWQAGSTVQGAGTLADKAIAAASEADRKICKARHGAKTPGFRKCYPASSGGKALKAWRGGGLQAFNTVMISYVTTLTLVEKAKGKKPTLVEALKLLKPAACGVEGVIKQWKKMLGAVADVILGVTRFATGGKCP